MTSLVERPFALVEVAISAKAEVIGKKPSFSFSVVPPTAQQLELEAAIAALTKNDSSLTYRIDPDAGWITIGALDEIQLDRAIMALKAMIGKEFEIGPLKVGYREKLTRRIEKTYTYKKQFGRDVQFARVTIVFEPNQAGGGSAFESKIVGGAVPQDYVPGVEKGINSVMGSGVLAGFPVVDVNATLIDGAFHDVDSSALTFETAARAAFREALREGGSILLEPIMKVEVTVPEDYTGALTGDLLARSGQVQGQSLRETTFVARAMVPLANMFGYINQLRSLSQGTGKFVMAFSHYAPVPPRPNLPDDTGPFAPALAMRA